MFVCLAGEAPIPLEVMVRKASNAPAEGNAITYMHKGSYRLASGADEPRLHRVRQQGDPSNPVKAPTITGSVTPKKRKGSKTLPSGKTLREALARGRNGTHGDPNETTTGVPAVVSTGESTSVYVDLSGPGRIERCVELRGDHLHFHLEHLLGLAPDETVEVVLQLPDRTFHQLQALLERHHSNGTVLQVLEPSTPALSNLFHLGKGPSASTTGSEIHPDHPNGERA